MTNTTYADRHADRQAHRSQQEQSQVGRTALEVLNRTTEFPKTVRDEMYAQAWKNSNADIYLSVEDAYRDLADIAHSRK